MKWSCGEGGHLIPKTPLGVDIGIRHPTKTTSSSLGSWAPSCKHAGAYKNYMGKIALGRYCHHSQPKPNTCLSLDGLSLAVNHGIRSHNATNSWVYLYDFELHGSHASTDEEYVTFTDWSVGLSEIWLQVHLKEISEKINVMIMKDQHTLFSTISGLSLVSLKKKIFPGKYRNGMA